MREYIMENYLEHHGVQGQKWYVRRYQPYPSGKKPQGAKEVGAAKKVEQRIATRTTKTNKKITRMEARYTKKQNALKSENADMAKSRSENEENLKVSDTNAAYYKGKSKELESKILKIDYDTTQNSERINELTNILNQSSASAIAKRNKAISKYEKYKNKKLKDISGDEINKGRDYVNELLVGRSQVSSAKTDVARSIEKKIERKAKGTVNKIARIEKRDKKNRGHIYNEISDIRESNKELSGQREEYALRKVNTDSKVSKWESKALKAKSNIGAIDYQTKENDAQIRSYQETLDNKKQKALNKLEKYKKRQYKKLNK